MSEKGEGTLNKKCPADTIIANFAERSISAINEAWKDVEMHWIKGMPIPTNAVTLIYGQAGVGKTRFALSLARVLIDQGYVVVYADFENTKIFRTEEQMLAFKKDSKRHRFFYVTPSSDSNLIGYLLLEKVLQLANALRERKKRVFVIVDSLEMVIEDTSKDVDVAHFFMLWKKYQIYGLILHHPRKLQKDEKHFTYKGSSKIRQAVDMMIELSKSEGVVETKLYFTVMKHRPLVTVKNFVVTLNNDEKLVKVDFDITPDDIKVLRRIVAFFERCDNKQITKRDLERQLGIRGVAGQLIARFMPYFNVSYPRKNSMLVCLDPQKIADLKDFLDYTDMPRKDDPDLTF